MAHAVGAPSRAADSLARTSSWSTEGTSGTIAASGIRLACWWGTCHRQAWCAWLVGGSVNLQSDGQTLSSARQLFGAELRRHRQLRRLSQEQLAALVVHSRTLVAAVELGERWPPQELAVRCDTVLRTDGALSRLWPLVEEEHQAAREVVKGVKLSDLRALVLRLAALTGTDLTALTASEAGPHEQAGGSGDG